MAKECAVGSIVTYKGDTWVCVATNNPPKGGPQVNDARPETVQVTDPKAPKPASDALQRAFDVMKKPPDPRMLGR